MITVRTIKLLDKDWTNKQKKTVQEYQTNFYRCTKNLLYSQKMKSEFIVAKFIWFLILISPQVGKRYFCVGSKHMADDKIAQNFSLIVKITQQFLWYFLISTINHKQ